MARAGKTRGPAPVHLWDPEFCGDLDMRIASDGRWFYMGTPIGRPALVELFASVLKKEGEKYFLVTPVEKIGITVDDAPFLVVEMDVADSANGPVLHFRTNVGELFEVGEGHDLRFVEEPETKGIKPYVHVRSGMEALVNRAVFYPLMDRMTEREEAGRLFHGIESGGKFYPVAPVE